MKGVCHDRCTHLSFPPPPSSFGSLSSHDVHPSAPALGPPAVASSKLPEDLPQDTLRSLCATLLDGIWMIVSETRTLAQRSPLDAASPGSVLSSRLLEVRSPGSVRAAVTPLAVAWIPTSLILHRLTATP
jgi:hypothetical protein